MTDGLERAAAGPGGSGTVTVRNADGSIAYSLTPFDADGRIGGARVAIGDVTGDGVPDLVVSTGPGVPARVVVIDGATCQPVRTVTPFEGTFSGGVFVSLADIDGDGHADIAVSPDVGGGGRVQLFSGATGGELANLFGIKDDHFRGGTRVAFGDFNGDGVPDMAVGAGFLGGPRVSLYDGTTLRPGVTPANLVNDFFVFVLSLRDGAYVTAGDVNGDGFDDLIAGGGPTGGPRILALDGQTLLASMRAGRGLDGATVLANFFAGSETLRSGVRVAAKDLDGGRPGGTGGRAAGAGDREQPRRGAGDRVFVPATHPVRHAPGVVVNRRIPRGGHRDLRWLTVLTRPEADAVLGKLADPYRLMVEVATPAGPES